MPDTLNVTASICFARRAHRRSAARELLPHQTQAIDVGRVRLIGALVVG